ncbi:MAG: hypothetical protein J6D21_11510 [Clostridia bacterium]|nr:hypothetical protein [Clostridia bacterium]
MKLRRAIALFLCLLLLAPLTACGKTLTDEEALAILRERIEASYELNEIYFGAGLRTDPYEDNGEAFQYVFVAIDEKYQSVDDLKAATEAVFSATVCGKLYEKAFTGVDDGQVILYARYVEQGGILTADVKYQGIPTARDFLFETAKILENTANYVVFEIERAEHDKPVRIEMTRAADGRWLLNSYTY